MYQYELADPVHTTHTSLALGQKDKFYQQNPIDFLETILKKDMSSVPKNQQYVPNMNILFYKRLYIMG